VLTPDFWGGQRDEARGVQAQRQRLQAVGNAEVDHRQCPYPWAGQCPA
jgi:hypothetical protein